MENVLKRKSIRLNNYDYSQPGYYFITICVEKRISILGKIENKTIQLTNFGEIVKRYWQEIPLNFPNIALDKFVIMPNHIHGILIIDSPVGAIHELPLLINDRKQRRLMTIPKVIGKFKMQSAKSINILRKTPNNPFWQRNYFEQIIKGNNSLEKIRYYIDSNPENWETDPENLKNC
ncbi:MAG: transposase [bacterium]